MAFYTSDFRETADISHTHRPTLLPPDSTGHRALQDGCVPVHWGLERQLSSPEKGFSVEAELAVFKLGLWLARRPSGIICAPSCQTGATILGRGGIYCPHWSNKKPFLSLSFAGSFCLQRLLLPQPVQYLTYHVCILPQQSRPVCYQEQVPNRSMEFSQQASGTACCQGNCGQAGNTIKPQIWKRKARPPFRLESAQVQAVP